MPIVVRPSIVHQLEIIKNSISITISLKPTLAIMLDPCKVEFRE